MIRPGSGIQKVGERFPATGAIGVLEDAALGFEGSLVQANPEYKPDFDGVEENKALGPMRKTLTWSASHWIGTAGAVTSAPKEHPGRHDRILFCQQAFFVPLQYFPASSVYTYRWTRRWTNIGQWPSRISRSPR